MWPAIGPRRARTLAFDHVNLFSIWPQFGFRENPYDNEGLPADETGDALLVGRDGEVSEVQRKIASSGQHPSVEGPAGVGKSSMLAVAGYRMMQQTVAAANGTLFVPARRFFQASQSQDHFEEEVWHEIAQTMIENVEAFRRAGLEVPDIEGLNKWLNSPQYRSAGANLSLFGDSTARSRTPPTGSHAPASKPRCVSNSGAVSPRTERAPLCACSTTWNCCRRPRRRVRRWRLSAIGCSTSKGFAGCSAGRAAS